MTHFEQMLLDKGYIKHVLNCNTQRFKPVNGHALSTMENLDHRYFHKTDTEVLKKIADGKSVMDDDFTWNDRKGEICFGLHECGKPPTLISPRPRIEVKRVRENLEVIEDERYDDSMNVVLANVPHDEIFKAMYDKSIVIRIDLTE